MSGNGPAPRVRIRFSKHGKVRFTSHRDLARIWERALRRAGVAVAYSEGFSPRPKLSFGLALSTGHESEAEYLDVALRDAPGPEAVEQLPALLAPALPAGVEVQAATVLPPGAASLQQVVTSCTWYIEIGDVAPDEVAAGVARGTGLHRTAADPIPQGPHRHRRRAARHPRRVPARSGDRDRRPARPPGDRSRHRTRSRAGHATAWPAPHRADRSDRSGLGGGKGHTKSPMDAGRRRPVRGHRPRTGSDAASARRGACVMRRELIHVRDRRFRQPGGAEAGP